jgi:hypothetical protein
MNMQANHPEPHIAIGPDEAKSLPTWRAAFSERTAELMAKLALLEAVLKLHNMLAGRSPV